jgi:hypothetical protein
MASEHAVLIVAKLSDTGFGDAHERELLRKLAEGARRVVGNSEAGEYDGDEFGQGQCTLFFYGPNADRLFGAIVGGLQGFRFAEGSYAIKRYGPPGDRSRQVRIDLNERFQSESAPKFR